MYAAVPYWRYFQLPRDRKVAAAMLRVQTRMREIAATARARLEASPEARESPKTALEAMLALEFRPDGEGRMSEQEVLANILTLLLAGEETTSNTLAWIAYELLCSPEIQRKLQEEVDRELPSRLGLENFRDPQRLSYLEGLAQETLRVRSTTPIMFMQATETTVIDGVELTPKDMVVILSRVGAMREKNFSDAKAFCPERWIRSDHEMSARCPVHEPKSVMTFGSGPRICPGRNLALIEIHAVISMLARNFVLEWDGAPTQVQEIFEFTVRPSAYRARLRLREGVSSNG